LERVIRVLDSTIQATTYWFLAIVVALRVPVHLVRVKVKVGVEIRGTVEIKVRDKVDLKIRLTLEIRETIWMEVRVNSERPSIPCLVCTPVHWDF
jgi:hypothetical protein